MSKSWIDTKIPTQHGNQPETEMKLDTFRRFFAAVKFKFPTNRKRKGNIFEKMAAIHTATSWLLPEMSRTIKFMRIYSLVWEKFGKHLNVQSSGNGNGFPFEKWRQSTRAPFGCSLHIRYPPPPATPIPFLTKYKMVLYISPNQHFNIGFPPSIFSARLLRGLVFF